MDTIRKLETIGASWYKDLPHLPVRGQKWLAENMWWLVLIGVILGAIGALQVIIATWFVGALVGGMFGGIIGGAVLSGLALFTVGLTMALSIVSLVLLGMAITPLRAQQKKGWTLLFVVLLIGLVSTLVGFVLSWSFGSLLTGLISLAIGGYFLYEVRSYYGKVHVSKKRRVARKH